MTEKTQPTRMLAFVAAIAVALPASMAFAAAKPGAYAGQSIVEIVETLEQQGYRVREIERENGGFEAEAVRDGQNYEIYVDLESGKISKVEKDD